MRIACLIVVLCLSGCSDVDRSGATGGPEQQEPEQQEQPPVTLRNLDYIDMYYGNVAEHPLVCGAGGDFPTGREMIFRSGEPAEEIHAVFPEGVTPPDTFDGKFVLHGRFQGIQKWDRYTHKKPPKDYQYLVVSSWEHGK